MVMKSTLVTLVSLLWFFRDVLVYSVYYILWQLIRTVNGIVETSEQQNDNVQVGRIIWRRKLSVFTNASPSDFLCFSFSKVDPDYVLKPNVSLYCVTHHEATFVETPESINLYSSDENPFLYMAQFGRSKRVIKMPIETFYKLASKIGDPRIPVVWISSTGRCGSTILSQVFEAIPGTLVLAEPQAPQNVALLRKFNMVNQSEYEKIFHAIVRMLCKPQPGTSMICIKATPAALPLMTDISRLFPNLKHVFSYRNCLETVSSWLGLMASTSYTVVLRASIDNEWFSSFIPLGRNHFINMLINQPNELRHVSLETNTIGLFTHMWANFMFIARNTVSQKKNILSVKYEELLADPLCTCSRLFQNIGLDQKYLDRVADVFKQDSQRGSILSRSRVGDDPRRLISSPDRIKAEAILSLYDLPQLHDDYRL